MAASVPPNVRRVEAARTARLEGLFNAHVDLVWRTARRFGLSAADADDACQQVFVVASRKLEEIGLGQEKSFLVCAAIHVARTMVRSRLRKREDLMEDPDAMDAGPSPEESLARARARAAVHRILASMDEDLRVAFVLFELEEMTMSEVAKLLDIPPGTVASRIRRAREVFRAATSSGQHR
jgi:RNA polymerase sigma-70 factor (ECF subfamily)